MEIVCDTNVWYKLGNGELDINVFGNHDLIVTALTVIELGSSERLLDPHEAIKVRGACIAIFKYAHHIEMLQPTNFMLYKSGNTLHHINEKVKENIIEKIDSLKDFAMMSDEEIEKKNLDAKLEDLVKEWKQPYQEFTEKFNELLNRVRLNIKKNKTNKKHHRNTNNYSDIKNFHESIIIDSLNLNTTTLIIDWSKFEFLSNSTDLFFKELELSKMNFEQNDIIDLFNLAYVTNERKYCTIDKRGVYGVTKKSPITAPIFYEINQKS